MDTARSVFVVVGDSLSHFACIIQHVSFVRSKCPETRTAKEIQEKKKSQTDA